MAWIVRGKWKTRAMDNCKAGFVILELGCQSLEDAQEVYEDRKRCYFDLEIVEVNALTKI
jgi:hypothetical protein